MGTAASRQRRRDVLAGVAVNWPWRRSEARSLAATDAVVAGILARAQGETDTADALAALEAAAGFVGRAFSAGVASGPGAAFITPRTLELIGRELVRSGECVFSIETMPEPMLKPAATWDLRGGDQAERWVYRLDFAGPSRTRSAFLSSTSVVHVRVNVHPARPWAGRAAHRIASATSSTASAAETSARGEFDIKSGRILSMPGTPGQLDTARGELAKGGLFLASSGRDANMAGRQDTSAQWKPSRIGPEPDPSHAQLRSEAALDVLSACGLSGALFDNRADGTARREALRQALHVVIQPWGRIVQEELSKKLGAVSLSFDSLFAADLSGRARAFQSMVGGGMEVGRAAALAGLMESE